MTVIAVKDGVLACDRLVTSDTVVLGYKEKMLKTNLGAMVGAGSGLSIEKKMQSFLRFKDFAHPDVVEAFSCTNSNMVWLSRAGDLLINEGGVWSSLECEFYADGSGASFAIGAMAAGADAEEACRIACEYERTCGGRLSVYVAPDYERK